MMRAGMLNEVVGQSHLVLSYVVGKISGPNPYAVCKNVSTSDHWCLLR